MKIIFRLLFPAFFLVLLLSTTAARHAHKPDPYAAVEKQVLAVQKKADSLVIAFYGAENFRRYIRLDSSASKFISSAQDWKTRPPFTARRQLLQNPAAYIFSYRIVHPYFSGEQTDIHFMLDSAGNVYVKKKDGYYLFDTHTQGLQKSPDFSQLTDSAAALEVIRQQVTTQPHEGPVYMTWLHGMENYQPVDTTKEFTSLYWGHWAWAVTFRISEPYIQGDEGFSGLETWYVDAFTGKFLPFR